MIDPVGFYRYLTETPAARDRLTAMAQGEGTERRSVGCEYDAQAISQHCTRRAMRRTSLQHLLDMNSTTLANPSRLLSSLGNSFRVMLTFKPAIAPFL